MVNKKRDVEKEGGSTFAYGMVCKNYCGTRCTTA